NVTATFAGPVGTTFTLLSASSGVASFSFHSNTAQSGALTLGQIVANVPSTAASIYTSKELLHLSSIVINGGNTTVLADDGVQVVAYLGDVNGDGTFTGADR